MNNNAMIGKMPLQKVIKRVQRCASLLVKDAYPPKRKCAREQVLITPALSAIQDTQVINRSGTADIRL